MQNEAVISGGSMWGWRCFWRPVIAHLCPQPVQGAKRRSRSRPAGRPSSSISADEVESLSWDCTGPGRPVSLPSGTEPGATTTTRPSRWQPSRWIYFWGPFAAFGGRLHFIDDVDDLGQYGPGYPGVHHPASPPGVGELDAPAWGNLLQVWTPSGNVSIGVRKRCTWRPNYDRPGRI